jgi:hypothetical protein
VISYQLSAISYQLSAISYQLSVPERLSAPSGQAYARSIGDKNQILNVMLQ